MFLIVGYVIILAASIGTYAVHGSLAALWVPLEYLAIFGFLFQSPDFHHGCGERASL